MFCCSLKCACRGCERHNSPRTWTPFARQVGEHVADLGTGADEALVGVALPVGEVDPVVRSEGAEHLVEAGEVLGPVDQHLDAVALGPRRAVAATAVDLGGGVAAFVRREEPVVEVWGAFVGRQFVTMAIPLDLRRFPPGPLYSFSPGRLLACSIHETSWSSSRSSSS